MTAPDPAALGAAYGLTFPGAPRPLPGGTASRVWRLEGPGGPLLLRALSGEEQGAREYAVTRHLLAHGFSGVAPILPTASGAPAARLGEDWYQLQALLPYPKLDAARPGAAARAARTVLSLEDALAPCPPVAPGPGQVIHGDLGPWNMLDGGPLGLFVLDFGALRMGDPYFDLATALCGLLNHVPEPDRPRVLSEFLAACGPLDRPRLLAQADLWAREGEAAWPHDPLMLRRFRAARAYLRAHL